MATTNQAVVERSMKLLGLLDPGESATTDELTECISVLQNLIYEYHSLSLISGNAEAISVAITSGSASGSVPASAGFEPISAYAYPDSSSDDIEEIKIKSFIEWGDKLISTDAGTTITECFFSRDDEGDNTLYVSPKPDAASTVVLFSREFAEQADQTPTGVLNIRLEEERFLINALAIEIAPMFGVEAVSQIYRSHAKLEKQLKRRASVSIMIKDIKFSRIFNQRSSYDFLAG